MLEKNPRFLSFEKQIKLFEIKDNFGINIEIIIHSKDYKFRKFYVIFISNFLDSLFMLTVEKEGIITTIVFSIARCFLGDAKILKVIALMADTPMTIQL